MSSCRGSTIARGLFDKKSDKLCKDVIQKPAEVFQGSGKTFKVTLMSKGESKTIECPDDMYILEAADKNGIDLPACCRGMHNDYSCSLLFPCHVERMPQFILSSSEGV